MRHALKTHPEQYKYIEAGTKTFEIRKGDRPFEVGDRLLLQEYDPATGMYTRKECEREITHILKGSAQMELWGLNKDFVILSIKPYENPYNYQ